MYSQSSEIYDGISGFLGKLLTMIEDKRTNHLIKWSDDGYSFVILNQLEFSRLLLPMYYKHNNMASFTRQLNMYGFHKVITSTCNEPDRVEFCHPFFIKGKPHLLRNIKRRINMTSLRENYPIRPITHESMEMLINEISDIKGKQQTLDTQLNTVKQENEILWRELSLLRHKHASQQHIVNKLIRFLMVLAPQSNNECSKRKYMPLMIKDSRGHLSEFEYSKEQEHSDHEYVKDSTSPGPIIHEIHPNDVLDVETCVESPSNAETETWIVTSPSAMLKSPEMTSSPESIQTTFVSVPNENGVSTVYIPVTDDTTRRYRKIAPKLTPKQEQPSDNNDDDDDDDNNILLDLIEKSNVVDSNMEIITVPLHADDLEEECNDDSISTDTVIRTKTLDNDHKLTSAFHNKERSSAGITTTSKKDIRKRAADHPVVGGSYRLSRTGPGLEADRLKPRTVSRLCRMPKLTRITTNTPVETCQDDTDECVVEPTGYILGFDSNGDICVQPESKEQIELRCKNRKRKIDEPFKTVPMRLILNPATKNKNDATVKNNAVIDKLNASDSNRISSINSLRSGASKSQQQQQQPVKVSVDVPNNKYPDTSNLLKEAFRTADSGDDTNLNKTDDEVLLKLVESTTDNDSLLNCLKSEKSRLSAIADEINSLLSTAATDGGTTDDKNRSSKINNIADTALSANVVDGIRGENDGYIKDSINDVDDLLTATARGTRDGRDCSIKKTINNITAGNRSSILGNKKIEDFVRSLLQSPKRRDEPVTISDASNSDSSVSADVNMIGDGGVGQFFEVGAEHDADNFFFVDAAENTTSSEFSNMASPKQNPSLSTLSSWQVSDSTDLTSSIVRNVDDVTMQKQPTDLSIARTNSRFDSSNSSSTTNKTYNADDISDHLDSVQADLDNLRDLIKKQGISVDYNTLVDLFNDDSKNYDFLEADHSTTNKTKIVEGNELVSCNSPFNLSNSDIIDFNDWPNWNSPNISQSDLWSNSNSTANDVDSILNTPQPSVQSVKSPSSEKRIKMS